MEAKKEKKKKRNKENKKNKNKNNYVECDGLIRDGIMKGVTILPSSSARMKSDFRIFKKSAAAYTLAKGYKNWTGIIEMLKPVPDR